MSEQNGNIESWEGLDERISSLGLHIEAGSANWVSRIIDYASNIKVERDKAEAKLAKAMSALDEAIYLLDPDDEDIAKETGLHRIVTICAELKGEN